MSLSSSYHGLTLLSIVSLVHTPNTCWNQFFLRLYCSAVSICGFLDHSALSGHLVNHHFRQNPLFPSTLQPSACAGPWEATFLYFPVSFSRHPPSVMAMCHLPSLHLATPRASVNQLCMGYHMKSLYVLWVCLTGGIPGPDSIP